MTKSNYLLKELTDMMMKEYPELLTFEHFCNNLSDSVTLDHILQAIIKQNTHFGVALCKDGLIIGDMFSSNPAHSALWFLTVPLSRQPAVTISFILSAIKQNRK